MARRMAADAKVWTLEELHRLPDDGNKYELVHGELLVTPAPSPEHEEIAARLARILDRYVEANGLGYVYRPRAVIQHEGSQVEPDMMVRRPRLRSGKGWADAPLPILVVEILSPITRRRDREHKRDFYIDDVAVPEYWIVDPDRREITIVKPGAANEIVREQIVWSPAGTSSPLIVDVGRVFAEDGTS